jgi:hypothetical protein
MDHLSPLELPRIESVGLGPTGSTIHLEGVNRLFTYRGLWDWLDDPFQTPPGPPPVEQLALGFPGLGQQSQ